VGLAAPDQGNPSGILGKLLVLSVAGNKGIVVHGGCDLAIYGLPVIRSMQASSFYINQPIERNGYVVRANFYIEGGVASRLKIVFVNPDVARCAGGTNHIGIQRVVLNMPNASEIQMGNDHTAGRAAGCAATVTTNGEAVKTEVSVALAAINGSVGTDHRIVNG
jgi:hypothetical protein